MKINIPIKLVVEFDEGISPTEYDDFLKSKLAEKGLELVFPFGHEEYVLILKDKVDGTSPFNK